ncbi:MAG: chain length determinant protein EpsF [Cytophagales bacterium]|nr:chain length determinant protein EpsF [Rhizobacter sp.]
MGNSLNFRQVLLILRLRWPLVVALFTLVVLIAYGVSLQMPKKYTAETSLLLDVRADPLVATLMPSIASREFLGTQVEIIQSDRLAGRVVRMLGMTDGPAAVEQWRQATQGRVPIETYYGAMLRSGLTVVPARNTNLIDIGFTGSDPRFVAAAANAFARAYIEFSVELRIEPSRQYGSFFDERLKSLRTQFEEAQRKLSTFQRDRGIVATERVDLESARLNTIMSQLSTAQAELADTNSRQRNTGTETSPDVQLSSVVQGLKSELARAETKLSEISSIVGSNHPQRVQLDAQIAEIKQQITSEMRRVSGVTATVNRVTGQKIGELSAMADAQKRTVLALRAQFDEMAVLQRDVETAQRAYDAVATRRSQVSLESQADQASARVLTPAAEPLAPSSPNIRKNMLAATGLGLLLAIGAALAWELLDRRVRSPADLTIVEGVPLLGVVSPWANRGRGPHRPRGPLNLPHTGKNMPPQLTLEEGN